MATSTDLRSAIEEVQQQLPEDQLLGGAEDAYEADFATKLEQRVGALPWWVISAVVHSVIFLLATLIGVAVPAPNTDEVVITSDIAKKEEPKYDEKKKRDIFKNPQEVKAETQVENPVVVHEQAEISDTFETDNNMDSQSARGSEDAISDIPLGGTGVTGSMGVGGGGMAGCFGYRDGGGRKKMVARFGGSKATESAVEAALRWLARHQDARGFWATDRLEGKAKQYNAMAAVATLAFLGAGYTHKSGKYKDNVQRALSWIISHQKDSGMIYSADVDQKGYGPGYTHAICGLALAEAYGMSKDPWLRAAAQKAVDYSMKHQKPYSGWRYAAKKDADTSVTGWFVMQLKSAKVAGLKVDGAGFQGAMAYIDKVHGNDGLGKYQPRSSKSGTTVTAIALVCRLFMGARNTEQRMIKGADFIGKRLPKAEGPAWKGTWSWYYWYYGTLACFQMGKKHWDPWNKALKKALLPTQRKGGDEDGSWDPKGPSRQGAYTCGRPWSTAVGALCLEVYYRYLPVYGK